MRIATLTLNPCIDKAYYCEDIEINRLNRAVKTTVSVGSKGINVSRVLKLFGVDAPAYCFLGGAAGKLAAELMNVSCVPVFTQAETRMNIKLIDTKNDTFTEINENGGPIEPSELSEMLERLDAISEPDILSLGGSIPAGVTKTVYADIIRLMKGKNIRCTLDCDGEALKYGIEQRPYLIKPNRYELETFTGLRYTSLKDTGAACMGIYEKYGCIVLNTLGADGAIIACPDGLFHVSAPKVTAIGFAGAGDTFLAAFLHNSLNGGGVKESMALAASAAAAKVTVEGTEMPPPERLAEYAEQVAVSKM